MDNYSRLDEQLRQMTTIPGVEHLPVFCSSSLDKGKLASLLADEVRALLSRFGEWRELIEELNKPISVIDRHEVLIGYHLLMERGDLTDPVLQRARIISQLYFDLLYFRDTIFIILRKRLNELGDVSRDYPNMKEWLELFGDGDFARRLRSLRNGFAHGRWSYLSDYSGIICYPEQNPPYTPHLWTQKELGYAHALLYSFQCVLFQEAKAAIVAEPS